MSTGTFQSNNRLSDEVHDTWELPAAHLDVVSSETPINGDLFLTQCMGNAGFAAALLEEFGKSSSSRLDAFDVALKDGNRKAIKSEAHALKGVAGILTANVLFETCRNMELAVADGDMESVLNLVQTLRSEVQRVIEFIPSLRLSV